MVHVLLHELPLRCDQKTGLDHLLPGNVLLGVLRLHHHQPLAHVPDRSGRRESRTRHDFTLVLLEVEPHPQLSPVGIHRLVTQLVQAHELRF